MDGPSLAKSTETGQKLCPAPASFGTQVPPPISGAAKKVPVRFSEGVASNLPFKDD